MILGQEIKYNGELKIANDLKISYVSQNTDYLKGNLKNFSQDNKIDESIFKAMLSKMGFSKLDFDTKIEERDGDEVRYYGGCRICPKETEVINPAFDIVPKELITGIITENGIIDPI